MGIFRRPPQAEWRLLRTISTEVNVFLCVLSICLMASPRSPPSPKQTDISSLPSDAVMMRIFSFSFELSASDANTENSTERPHLEEIRRTERTWQVWLYSKYLPGFSPNLFICSLQPGQQATPQACNKDILELNKDVLRFNGEGLTYLLNSSFCRGGWLFIL